MDTTRLSGLVAPGYTRRRMARTARLIDLIGTETAPQSNNERLIDLIGTETETETDDDDDRWLRQLAFRAIQHEANEADTDEAKTQVAHMLDRWWELEKSRAECE